VKIDLGTLGGQPTLDLYTQEDSDEARAAQGEFLRALGLQSELVQ
jgi:hypothetical protein